MFNPRPSPTGPGRQMWTTETAQGTLAQPHSIRKHSPLVHLALPCPDHRRQQPSCVPVCVRAHSTTHAESDHTPLVTDSTTHGVSHTHAHPWSVMHSVTYVNPQCYLQTHTHAHTHTKPLPSFRPILSLNKKPTSLMCEHSCLCVMHMCLAMHMHECSHVKGTWSRAAGSVLSLPQG